MKKPSSARTLSDILNQQPAQTPTPKKRRKSAASVGTSISTDYAAANLEQSTHQQYAPKKTSKPTQTKKVNRRTHRLASIDNSHHDQSTPDTNTSDFEAEPLSTSKPVSEARLRGLAFAYLTRREYSQKTLTKKLLDAGGSTEQVTALVTEFASKGYQSDIRLQEAVIRTGIRKGQGKRRIQQKLKQEEATSTEIADILAEMPDQEVDWLAIAVRARVKRFGDAAPTDAKHKAKQLRFLQYRGFDTEICYQALKHDLISVKDHEY